MLPATSRASWVLSPAQASQKFLAEPHGGRTASGCQLFRQGQRRGVELIVVRQSRREADPLGVRRRDRVTPEDQLPRAPFTDALHEKDGDDGGNEADPDFGKIRRSHVRATR